MKHKLNKHDENNPDHKLMKSLKISDEINTQTKADLKEEQNRQDNEDRKHFIGNYSCQKTKEGDIFILLNK